MFKRTVFVSGILLALASCGGSPNPTQDASAPTAPVVDVAETDAPAADAGMDGEAAPAPEASGEENLAQPEWDALDRVTDSCGMAAIRPFMGQPASDIPEDRLPEQYRILAPGDQATLDYVPRRLNVLTNEDGIVISMRCG